MRTKQLHVGRTLRQAQQFLDGHADVVGPANESEARQVLNSAVSRLDASAVEQGTRTREAHGEVTLRKQLERRLVKQFMTPLSKLARAKLQASANISSLTPSGNALRSERLAGSARSMIEAAKPYAATLAAAKFPADFLDRFTGAVDTITTSTRARADGHIRRVGATKAVRDALHDGRTALAELDAVVSHLILGNGRLEQEWRTATRITKSTGTRSKPAPAAPEVPATAPQTQPVPSAEEAHAGV
jgi:hypothetical protein